MLNKLVMLRKKLEHETDPKSYRNILRYPCVSGNDTQRRQFLFNPELGHVFSTSLLFFV